MALDTAEKINPFRRRAAAGGLLTIGAFGLTVVLRFGTNVVLSRLVAPEIFGIAAIINTLKTGVELITDVGIGQSVVRNAKGGDPTFYNTAWTVQAMRGLALFVILFVMAFPLSQFYGISAGAIQLGALTLLLLGLSSTSLFLLQRDLKVGRLNSFDLCMDLAGSALVILLTYLSPTIWGLVIASVLAASVRLVASHAIVPRHARNRFMLDRRHLNEILSFGKWIFVSSLLAFFCANFDKLYLAYSMPLAILGIYGIARNIADLPVMLMGRLGHLVLFPLIASHSQDSSVDVREQLRPIRLKVLSVAALAIGFGVSVSDLAVDLVYDPRYQEAGWMLSLSLLGAWAAILCTVNEYSVLGMGRPVYGATANLLKLGCMLVGLPLAFALSGLEAVILVIAGCEAVRYLPIAIGQRRLKLSFLRQDIMLSILMLCMVAAVLSVRHAAGYPYPLETIFPAFL
ncbi:oligosaccharide flippase family protein [Rhizobium sp. CC-YZS058]|uniref:oligosaccharide flippase family protein n=1 Tax=Rhizobium sp. CC-YZS058 TaxID=3042153 RepID=UPI002B058D11|nr:oligosaccharide flippase family protein [Rhizobium sp. CC-YZS058]MEA3537422.1 oligosaccharide flippase family protein [Rhizobium sp. CC-YZS058]